MSAEPVLRAPVHAPAAPPIAAEIRPPARRAWLPVINVTVSWVNNIFVALGSFLVTPATLLGLGDHNYGIWLLVTSFVGHMRILELGMTSGCMKYSSGSYERNDAETLQRVFSSSVAIFSGVALLVLGATFVMSAVLPGFFPDLLSGTHSVIIVLGLSVVVDMFFRPYAASLRARSYFFVYDGMETLTYLVFKLGLVLYFAHIGLSLLTLSLITLGECVVRNGSVFLLALKYCRWTARPKPSHVDRPMLKKLAAFSGTCFLISVANLVSFQLSNAIIGKLVDDPARNIAIFGIGMQMIRIVTMSVGATWAVLIPRFSGLSEKGDTAAVRELLRRTTLVSGMFTVFAMISLSVFGLPFLSLWINKPWIDQSYLVMLLLIPGFAMALLQGPATGLLWGSGKLRLQAVITYIEAIANLALSLLLVGPYGIFGVCLGTAIPMIFVRGILFPLVLRRDCGIGVREYLGMFPPVLLAGAAYLALTIPFAFIPYRSLFELLPVCVLATFIFGGLVLLTVRDARQPTFDFIRATHMRFKRLLS
ncbi:MAG TPA: polysaccharide biosynthesis C-terminal domain-containing protein [Planctomycetota bacterium]|nr:polysaccharide biosynthesis C-terminal domain-containing protein [Planctomycetota bacterium]